MKHIVTIQDISCVGRCSATVALPIISAMGIETSVLPTAVLSTHTMFQNPEICDLTNEISPIVKHWKSQNVSFDGIYTGYLGSLEQMSLVEGFIDDFHNDGIVLIDPAMADNGRLYSAFDMDFVNRMKLFCGHADIIIPNLTEASLLLDTPYVGGEYDEGYIKELLKGLTRLGPKKAVITGVSFDNEKLGAMAYDSEADRYTSYFSERIGGYYHGTGDIFASVLMGALTNGLDMYDALGTAVEFVCECIKKTMNDSRPKEFGVNFEKALPMLCQRFSNM